MAKPKLALIPATQGSKLYSVLPADGVGDFTFSRGSAATRINKDGLIETVASGVSRLNYPMIDGKVVGCPSHLLEPSRSNLFPYSEDFENSDWTKNSGTTITNNYAISPDGTLNAARYLGTGASGLGDKFTLSATEYTISFYVKSNTGQNQYCRLIGDSTQISGDLLVTTEWQRIEFTFTASGLADKTNGIFRDSNNNDIDILIWGAQLEQGYPTSYIPTSGTTATRSAETANNSGDASTFNDSEGVLMYQIKPISLDGTHKRITLSDGTSNNRVIMGFDNNNNVIATVYDGSNQAILGGNYIGKDEMSKYALKYKENDFALWLNGFEVATDSSGITFPNNTLNQLRFEDGNGGLDFYGNTKQIQYFDSALNDSDLEKITTWTSFTDLANGQQYSIK